MTGRYDGMHGKLTLARSAVRMEPDMDDDHSDASLVLDTIHAGQSITFSRSDGDGGVFELRGDDPRYLPFELSGAVSSWQLELTQAVQTFDRNSISDVVMTLRYTAREGGDAYRSYVESWLQTRMLAPRPSEADAEGSPANFGTPNTLPRTLTPGTHTRMWPPVQCMPLSPLSLRHGMPDVWHRLRSTEPDEGETNITTNVVLEPFQVGHGAASGNVVYAFFAAILEDGASGPVGLSINGQNVNLQSGGSAPQGVAIDPNATDGVPATLDPNGVAPTWTLSVSPGALDQVRDLMILMVYLPDHHCTN